MDWKTLLDPKVLTQSVVGNAIWFIILAILGAILKALWHYLNRLRKTFKEEREIRIARRQIDAERLRSIASTPIGSAARFDALFVVDFEISRLQRGIEGMHYLSLVALILICGLFGMALFAHDVLARLLSLIAIIIAASLLIKISRTEATLQDDIGEYEKVVAEVIFPYVTLVDVQYSPNAVARDKPLELHYTIDSKADYPNGIWLGAHLSGGPKLIFNIAEDKTVQIKLGREVYTRTLTIPKDTPPGTYNLSMGLWLGQAGKPRTSKELFRRATAGSVIVTV